MEILESAGSFQGMDHPRHTQMRRLVSQAFSPRRVKALVELGEPRFLVGNFIHGVTAMPYRV